MKKHIRIDNAEDGWIVQLITSSPTMFAGHASAGEKQEVKTYLCKTQDELLDRVKQMTVV
jgi:hypothetical protein